MSVKRQLHKETKINNSLFVDTCCQILFFRILLNYVSTKVIFFLSNARNLAHVYLRYVRLICMFLSHQTQNKKAVILFLAQVKNLMVLNEIRSRILQNITFFLLFVSFDINKCLLFFYSRSVEKKNYTFLWWRRIASAHLASNGTEK